MTLEDRIQAIEVTNQTDSETLDMALRRLSALEAIGAAYDAYASIVDRSGVAEVPIGIPTAGRQELKILIDLIRSTRDNLTDEERELYKFIIGDNPLTSRFKFATLRTIRRGADKAQADLHDCMLRLEAKGYARRVAEEGNDVTWEPIPR